MPSAKTFMKGIDKVLTKTGPMTRTVFLRVTTVTGNSLIGRETTTTADTELKPARYSVTNEDLRIAGSVTVPAGSYSILISANAVTLAQLQNPRASIVLKDADGKVEVLKIISYKQTMWGGEGVAYRVFARSVSR